MKRIKLFLIIACLILTPITSLYGCRQTPEIVDFIYISPEVTQPPSVIVPSGEHTPFPKDIQLSVSPGDKIFIILGISVENKTSVEFSKYTFYNRGTKQEVKIDDAGDVGPFESGADVLIGFSNPWTVPDQSGTYEVRVYRDNELVAAAVFEVK